MWPRTDTFGLIVVFQCAAVLSPHVGESMTRRKANMEEIHAAHTKVSSATLLPVIGVADR